MRQADADGLLAILLLTPAVLSRCQALAVSGEGLLPRRLTQGSLPACRHLGSLRRHHLQAGVERCGGLPMDDRERAALLN